MIRLINATLEIMPLLDIEIRPSYKKDGKLKLSAWDKLQGQSAVFRIHSDINGIINQDSPDEMSYKDPFILTSHEMKPILANFNDSLENIKASQLLCMN